MRPNISLVDEAKAEQTLHERNAQTAWTQYRNIVFYGCATDAYGHSEPCLLFATLEYDGKKYCFLHYSLDQPPCAKESVRVKIRYYQHQIDVQNRKMKTFFSLFSGFDLTGIGAAQAGYKVIGGIEYDDAIAQVARDNEHPIATLDILDAKPSRFDIPDLLHASPPCPNFSVAKQNRDETAKDIALAEKVCEFLRAWKPRAFTLENVTAYRRSESFAKIMRTLDELGYVTDAQNINSADYGVPQKRRRLWVRAVRGGLVPMLPPKQKWVGWYDAIEDLIPTLPESKFADWQIPKLPREIRTFMMQVQGEGGDGILFAYEPMQTITANHGASKYRAFLVDGAGFDCEVTARTNDEPSGTVVSTAYKRPTRALLESGRVVSMTPRALARFQTIPDSFRLPHKKALACTGIGNGVPCELARVLYSRLLRDEMTQRDL